VAALELPQFYWLWAPLNFDDCSTHLALNDDAEGRHWYESACRVPLLGDGPAFGVEPDHYRSADVDVEWEPGTRRAQRVTLNLRPWRGDIDEITLTPVLTFQMKGLGYLHPEWGHGRWHGETATGAESWQLDQIDPLALPNLHVQALCDAQWGSRRGVGILEQLVIGLHAPSGFTSMMDGA
jgi:hypothetical protein